MLDSREREDAIPAVLLFMPVFPFKKKKPGFRGLFILFYFTGMAFSAISSANSCVSDSFLG